MDDVALLVIDMQVGNFSETCPIHDGQGLVKRVGRLIGRARDARIPVVFVKNRGGSGDPDEPGTPGFEIHPLVVPRENEVVVEKETPDAFHGTRLGAVLEGMGVRNLVVAGIQTEYCVDTTCRRASLLGYEVTLVEDAHSTWDSRLLPAQSIIAHHNLVLGGWFVSLVGEDGLRF